MTPATTPDGSNGPPEDRAAARDAGQQADRSSEGSIAERIADVVNRPTGTFATLATTTGIDAARHEGGSEEYEPSMEHYHAEFVAAHINAEPEQLPEGAAEDVAAVVAHLYAVADVLDVIETVEAEGRVATASEVAALVEPRTIIASGEFSDPADEPRHPVHPNHPDQVE